LRARLTGSDGGSAAAGIDAPPGNEETEAAPARVALESREDGEPATTLGEVASAWPDEAAESAFLAEARERGETPKAAGTAAEKVEETPARPLPPLEQLVERIPAGVRETLDDLFRARFVRVVRLPRKALKS
jgi:hypothetical protein